MNLSKVFFLLLLFAVSCGGKSVQPTARLGPQSADSFVETFVSPFGLHEGYATDGTFHYLDSANAISKRNNDSTWSEVTTNATPFVGIPGIGLNHFGDLDYFNGKLYVGAEHFMKCSDTNNSFLAVYNASDLSLSTAVNESAQNAEIAGVAVDGPNNLLYTVSFCDGTKIWKYDLTTLAFIGTITLSTPIHQIQGVAFHNGQFFISDNTNHTVDVVDLDGTFEGPIYHATVIGETEGIDYSQDTLRWQEEGSGLVHYLMPTGIPH